MKKLLLTASLSVSAAMAWAQNFTLKSPGLGGQATQKEFFNGFGCNGQNISPALQWENAPAGTAYYAVTIYDKDAPTGSGWWHWIMFNIPASVTQLKANAGDVSQHLAPEGAVQSITDYGKPGYGGPCPPAGPAHQYVITVYALKNKLDLDKNASPAMVGFYLNAGALAKASVVFYAQQ